MGQTDPLRERVVCRRRAKYTTSLTSAGQRQCTATHGTATHGTATHGTATHGTATHGTATHGTATHGTASTAPPARHRRQHGTAACKNAKSMNKRKQSVTRPLGPEQAVVETPNMAVQRFQFGTTAVTMTGEHCNSQCTTAAMAACSQKILFTVILLRCDGERFHRLFFCDSTVISVMAVEFSGSVRCDRSSRIGIFLSCCSFFLSYFDLMRPCQCDKEQHLLQAGRLLQGEVASQEACVPEKDWIINFISSSLALSSAANESQRRHEAAEVCTSASREQWMPHFMSKGNGIVSVSDRIFQLIQNI
ncbi:uncharacterized protein V6R79_013495 [Siganus canaliculatus]